MAGLRSVLTSHERARRARRQFARAAVRLAEEQLRRGGRGNRLKVGEDSLLWGLRLHVRGEDNQIVIGERARLHGVTVTIRGSGHRVEIGDEVRFTPRTDLWLEDEGSRLRVGERCTFEPGCVLAALEGQALTLGADCMLAGDIEIRTGDSHRIFDLDGPQAPFNVGRPVTLGEHVWVGKRSFVLKGVELADGVIVGAASVVTQSIPEPRCVAAGNPARMVRRGVDWRR